MTSIRTTFGVVAVVALLVLAGCAAAPSDDGGNSDSSGPLYETVSVGIQAGSSGATLEKALGSYEAIDHVSVVVSGEDAYGTYQEELASASLVLEDGAWTGMLLGLPIGPILSFTATGYDADDHEVYMGLTEQAVPGGASTVVIALAPVDDGEAVQFPIILNITVPESIAVEDEALVSVTMKGNALETLDYAFTSGGGSFDPTAGSLSLPSVGTGAVGVSYTAPSEDGTFEHVVRVTNSQGNAVETGFSTSIVLSSADPTVIGQFAPTVTGLTGRRIGEAVLWTATVEDDQPIEELSYLWSFEQTGGTDGAAFAIAGDNPGGLTGYDQTVTGSISLTVTDEDGHSTMVTFTLVAGQFPDIVATPPPVVKDHIDGGRYGYCGIINNVLRCWGNNVQGHLSLPPTIYPRQVAVGGLHSCVLDAWGVRCVGNPNGGKTTVPTLSNPREIAVGEGTSCAIDDTGVVCWGSFPSPLEPPSLENPRMLSMKAHMACALDGNVPVCWGSSPHLNDPHPTLFNPDSFEVGVAAKCAHDDTGWRCWGGSDYHNAGVVPELSNPVQISIGWWFGCALDDNGVQCWGDNIYNGQLDVPDLVNPTIVEAAEYNACALTDTGVECWGHFVSGHYDVSFE